MSRIRNDGILFTGAVHAQGGSRLDLGPGTQNTVTVQSSRVDINGQLGVNTGLGAAPGTFQVVCWEANWPAAILKGAALQIADLQQWQNSAAVVFKRINKDGFDIIKKTAAPADADLAASELTCWLDDTAGATKVMFKAKDSTGIVRTGSLALA